jgi:outer membrane murein-binding lipoprotein Lpp
LHKAFGQIKNDSTENEELNLNIFKSMSDSMMTDHVQTLKEIKEQEVLQDKKIAHMTRLMEQRTGRNRLIAIPGVIIAVIGVVYMFYVVNIMEKAMTNMSSDMHLMQLDVSSMSGSVGNISGDISSITLDTSSMSSNLQNLNGNVDHMSKDLNVLTHNVAPAMKGLRNVMPWSP